jgi:hypothetical protein
MTARTKPPITPQIKVADLLDAYPELEDVLVELAPPFKKLKNPVLRRTIARVTSLEKAAAVADLPLRELITGLRVAAGQPADEDGTDVGEDRPASSQDGPADWVDASRVVWTIDADRILNDGGQPINEAQNNARGLGNGDLGLIRSSFRPAPLIDLLEKQGYRTAVVRSGDSFATFVSRRPAGTRLQD